MTGMPPDVPPPMPTLSAWWCPDCGRQVGPNREPGKSHRRPVTQTRCAGTLEAITYELAPKRLPEIPARPFKISTAPRFVRVPEIGEGWYLLGPESSLTPGAVVLVERFREGDVTPAQVGKIVAERIVHHRAGSPYGPGPTRFVLAVPGSVLDE